MSKTVRQRIVDLVEYTMSNLLYYDRKEDDSLPVGVIEDAIIDHEISISEITALVEAELFKSTKKRYAERNRSES